MLWSRDFLTGLQDILKDQKALELVRWILDQALNGLGPLSSASELADEYRRKPYANDAERVQALIRWAAMKNGATGFVARPRGNTDVADHDSGLVGSLPGDSSPNGGGDCQDLRA